MNSSSLRLPIDVVTIQKLLPHRYPFLLVDRVTALDPLKSITAFKNLSYNDPFFQGHFPSRPIMPGVLILEALAQASGLLVRLSQPDDERQDTGTSLFYLVKIDKARFNHIVVPGDRLDLRVQLKRMLRNMGLFEAVATVADKEVASCELMCAGRSE